MRQLRTRYALALAALIATGSGAAQEPVPANARAAGYLPSAIAGTGLSRESAVRTYSGRSLFEYINGAAELYHQYGFVEVATAPYADADREITIDIYRFRDAIRAFGLLSAMRPAEPDTLGLGVAGFAYGPGLDFVKGEFVVRVVCYDESPATAELILRSAAAIAAHLPGTADLPAAFGHFPPAGRQPGTEKLIATSFLGQAFLRDAFSVDYALSDNELTLFLIADPQGEMYTQWSHEVAAQPATEVSLLSFPYDDDQAFAVRDAYHGVIIAGLRGGRLAGMINYHPHHQAFLVAWIKSLAHAD